MTTYYAYLRRIYGAFLTRVRNDIQEVIVHLRPLIEERQRMLEKYGTDWADKPVSNDNS